MRTEKELLEEGNSECTSRGCFGITGVSKKGKEPLLANICWSRVELEYFNLEAEILPFLSAQIW